MRLFQPAFAVMIAFVSMLLTASGHVAAIHAQSGDRRLQIVDVDSRTPVARARITSASAVTFAPIAADVHGEVSLQLPDGVTTIRIGKAGYVSRTLALDALASDSTVTLARGASIGGRLVDTTGAPQVGRAVQAERIGDETRKRYTATTNDLGEYRFGSLPDGTYAVSLPPLAPALSAAPTIADAISHTVIVRRGDEVSGIDFTTAYRAACAVADAVPSPFAVGYGTISGRVVTISDQPIACAEVTAFNGGARSAAVTTDASGRFVLRSLKGGSYSIEFKRSGYVTSQWGQSQAGEPGRPVALRDGENLRNIVIKLPHGGAISGTLVDEFGEPAENVSLRALELRGSDRPIAVGAATAISDDRGRYRLFGLAPGRFIVATTASTDPSDRRTGKGYAPVYYPGTVELASARSVDVGEQQERQWVDFAREPTRVATVTGFALNSASRPVTDRIILVASQRSGAVIAETQGADVKGGDGAFTIPNVPPGDYVLQATSKGADDTKEFGMQYVTVYQDDPPPVRVKTLPGVGIVGRLVEDGLPLVDPRRFAVTAEPTDWDQTSLLAGVQTMAAGSDGALSLPALTGPRRLVLTSAPAGWYLKSIRLRGVDVTDRVNGFPLGGLGFIRDLEVVVSNKGAIVEGDATDGSGAATDFSVVLFSTNPDHWYRNSRFVKHVRANAGGKFRIEGVADGDYFLVALDPLDGTAGGAWQEHDFLQSLVVSARRLRLREGDERSLTLTVTHR